MAVFRITYVSQCLERYVDLNVILPIDQSRMVDPLVLLNNPKPKLFKTLYLLHGYSGNQEDWMTGTRIQQLADIYNIAVVMPSGENSFYVDRDAANAKYGEMVGKELVEFTRRAFPLSPKREDTFIGGLSMGGFGALRLGSYYFDTFSKIVGFSSAFIVDKIAGIKEDYADDMGDYYFYRHIFGDPDKLADSPKDPFWCAKRAVKAGNMPLVYLTCGTEDDLIKANRSGVKRLRELGVKAEFHEAPGIHDWDYWNKEIEPAIKWLLDLK